MRTTSPCVRHIIGIRANITFIMNIVSMSRNITNTVNITNIMCITVRT